MAGITMLYYFLKLTSFIANAQQGCGPQPDGGYILCTKIPGVTGAVGGPVEYLSLIYKYSITVVGLVGFGLLVWSGVNYIFQRSNYAELADIKNHITQIVFGIILLVFASILLNEIDPNILSSLKGGEFKIAGINKSKLEQQHTNAEKARAEAFKKQQLAFKNATEKYRAAGNDPDLLNKAFNDLVILGENPAEQLGALKALETGSKDAPGPRVILFNFLTPERKKEVF